MTKLREALPQIFEGAEQVNKDDVVGYALDVIDYAEMNGTDGQWCVVKADVSGKQVKFNASSIILDKLKSAFQNATDGKVEAKLVKRTSDRKREYYDIVDVDEE